MNWTKIFKEESAKDYFKILQAKVYEDAKEHQVYPPLEDTYNAFKLCRFNHTKVVILGQDPYHGPGQAHGLSFSVPRGIEIPPSLRNIFKELKSDVGVDATCGDLTSWARQGILLLNASLTVRRGQAASHKDFGWDVFTNQIIAYLNEKESPVVFILWGGFARKKRVFIHNENHLILESAHPSPLSAHNGFFGSRPFSQTNVFLIQNNLTPIDWGTVAE